MSEEDMKIEQSKCDRKEYESTPEGMLRAAAKAELETEHPGITTGIQFEELQKLIDAKVKQMTSRITKGNYSAE